MDSCIKDTNRKTLEIIQMLCSEGEVLREREIEHLSDIAYDLRSYINKVKRLFKKNDTDLKSEYIILKNLEDITRRSYKDKEYIEGYIRFLEVYTKIHKITGIEYLLEYVENNSLNIDYNEGKVDTQGKDKLYLYNPEITYSGYTIDFKGVLGFFFKLEEDGKIRLEQEGDRIKIADRVIGEDSFKTFDFVFIIKDRWSFVDIYIQLRRNKRMTNREIIRLVRLCQSNNDILNTTQKKTYYSLYDYSDCMVCKFCDKLLDKEHIDNILVFCYGLTEYFRKNKIDDTEKRNIENEILNNKRDIDFRKCGLRLGAGKVSIEDVIKR